jgi:hypothetical protein
MLSLLGATLWAALRPGLLLQFFYSPEHLALVHLLTLGFLTSIIMGVLLRVAPFALGASQRSPWLARTQAALFLLGAAGMIAHFALGRWVGLAWSASCVLLASLVQLANLSAVFARAARGDLPALHVAAALVHLALAACLGIAYGCLRAWGAEAGFGTAQVPMLSRLGAHLLLAAGGWVGTMILGLQLKLLPDTAGSRRAVLLRFALWQGGLLGGATCLLLGLPGLPWALGAIALAAALHLAGPLSRLRRQGRSAGELLGLLLLFAAAVAALLASLDLPADSALRLRLVHATGYALLLGFGPLTVASAATKLFPMFVWEERFAADMGRKPVPPVVALASPRLRDAAVGALAVGLVTAATAIVIESKVLAAAGAWTVFAGAVLLVTGFARTASWALLKREWKPRG